MMIEMKESGIRGRMRLPNMSPFNAPRTQVKTSFASKMKAIA